MKKKITSKQYPIPLIKIYVVYIVVFVLWLTYRYTTRFSDITDELVAKPLIWLLPIIIVFLADSRQSFSSIFSFKNLSWKMILLGIGGGILLAILQIIPLRMNGYSEFHILPGLFDLTLATVGIAISEEILFRGFIFKQLQNYYSLITAYIIDSLLFSAIHIPILLFITNYTGNSLLIALYVTFASSIVFCWLYSYSKNLWVVILAHFIMDFLLLVY